MDVQKLNQMFIQAVDFLQKSIAKGREKGMYLVKKMMSLRKNTPEAVQKATNLK